MRATKTWTQMRRVADVVELETVTVETHAPGVSVRLRLTYWPSRRAAVHLAVDMSPAEARELADKLLRIAGSGSSAVWSARLGADAEGDDPRCAATAQRDGEVARG